MTRALVLTAATALALFLTAADGQAQLLSPGRLAEAHAELEGLRNCTSCHELGARGISSERCLECHEALGERIASGSGFHATVPRDTCADCHQDHLGEGFDLLRLDEDSFDHSDTGYLLERSHASVDCRDCHEPANIHDPSVVAFKTERGSLDRTFLGLADNCAGCHRDESPHGPQFGDRTCDECHDEGAWEEPPRFDHDVTAFPLEGLHADVDCVDCHGSGEEAVYTPIAYGRCNDCHDDPHAGAMTGTCASCHRTVGWTTISTSNMERFFDHSATGFPLAGAHADAACTACHQPGRPPRTALLRMSYVSGTQSATYPRPLFDTCRACHVDQHTTPNGEVRWGDCLACHSDARWLPSPYDVSRHAESVFPLTGSHLVTPCVACHQNQDRGQDAFTLSVPDQQCVACHEEDDPHEGIYEGMQCEQCHVTESFDLAQFDHDVVLDVPDPPTCASCHSDDDPHEGQFEDRDCAACHETEAEDFVIEAFDHGTTRFPLDGAHDGVECAACHAAEPGPEPLVRYRPLGVECSDCHAGL